MKLRSVFEALVRQGTFVLPSLVALTKASLANALKGMTMTTENPNPSQVAPQISAASALIGDPSQFGRVGDDGNVYVRTSQGEKIVGSYPGKSAEEALAYFVRKFESLASDVALTAARITSGAMVPDDTYEAVKKLRQQVRELNGVGDLEVEGHREKFEAKKQAEAEQKAARREQILVEKEKIVVEAESLALSESWKATGERLKTLLDEWKSAPRLDKKTDGDLWKRFSASRNKFDKRRRTHFAALEATASVVSTAKIAIVEEAEKLATSTEWVPTARRFKVLMDSWKAAGRGKPKDDAQMWARFKKSQDAFFAAKNADLEKREVSMSANLEKREALILTIEGLLPFTDVKVVKNEFRDLMREWEKIGITQRDKRAALDARVQVVEAAIKSAEAEVWRKSDPAAKARAADVVAQLTAAIENYEKVAEKSAKAGNDKKAQEARESAAARKVWLAEAQKNLSEFS